MSDANIPLLTDIVADPDENPDKRPPAPAPLTAVDTGAASAARAPAAGATASTRATGPGTETTAASADESEDMLDIAAFTGLPAFGDMTELTLESADESNTARALPDLPSASHGTGMSPDDCVVFEADDSRPGDTATHYVPSVDALQEALPVDEYEIVPASLRLALDDELPDSIAIDDAETVIAELQTRIASHVYELTDELMRSAFADIEARVFRQISTNLRQQLSELIDSVVREHLLERARRSEEGD